MRIFLRKGTAVVLSGLLCLAAMPAALASAYNGHPRLIVIIVIDQFRADYLEKFRDQFGESGFRTFLDRGAYFANCQYNYANTRTAPGHATLLTGAYTVGHGILSNEWWDPQKKKFVTSVEDSSTHLLGTPGNVPGASPQNLLASTLGDQLKLATQGKSRVFGIALKDRAAILPAGHAGDAAYWIDHDSGTWVTSSYYRNDLPKWVSDFNSSNRAGKYWEREWRDIDGSVLGSTKHRKHPDGTEAGFYEVVGSTPFANDYEFEFAKELVLYEQLGTGPNTDLLTISLSANDILGHQVGPDAPEMKAMVLAIDRQLGEFFDFLGHQVGLANVWMGLSADHGIAPLPSLASHLRLEASAINADQQRLALNKILSTRFTAGRSTEFVKMWEYPVAWLNNDAFIAAKIKEPDAEHAVGDALLQLGLRSYFTRTQLALGDAPNTPLGREYLNSYSPLGAWYVLGVPPPFAVGSLHGTDHASPYTYDRSVPLAFYGLPFQSGTYRSHAEPIDMVSTFSSLLGVIMPTHAVGRVLVEALAMDRRAGAPATPADHPKPTRSPADMRPALLVLPPEARP